MVLDGQGGLWIADGWLALAACSFVLSLALWCHGWIATDQPLWPTIKARGRRRSVSRLTRWLETPNSACSPLALAVRLCSRVAQPARH